MAAPLFPSQRSTTQPDEVKPLEVVATGEPGSVHPDEQPGSVALDLSAALTVPPLSWTEARPGKCLHNVQRFIAERGGNVASGWALADCGPMVRSDLATKPLYYRWINHLIWEDADHRLWEVTPYYDVQQQHDIAWAPTSFIVDRAAVPLINPQGFCSMQRARYVAARAEGIEVAKCLNALERDGSRFETYWLQQAVQALKHAGFESVEWHIERVEGQINNAWLFVN